MQVLYDFGYEVDDKLAVVQSLLLMTYWHEASSDGKDEWHWLGAAISVTTSFQNRAAIVDLEARDQKVWNRIWWCCFTRDRLLALGMRRAPRIMEDDYDSFTTPTLTLDDFEIGKLDTRSLTISLSDCRVVQDTSIQLKLAKTFIAKAELCVCIGHVLRSQYYPQVRGHGIRSESDGQLHFQTVLLPNPMADGLEAAEDELAYWLRWLPIGLLDDSLTTERVAADGASLFIERAVLHMIYLATRATLHRPQALLAAPAGSFGLQARACKIIREASTEITAIHLQLYRLNLTQYLPTTAVTVLIPAIINHIQSIQTATERSQIWEQATEGLTQCMQILHKLRENYHPADEAMEFLGEALRRAKIQVVTEQMPLGTSPSTTGFLHNREQELAQASDEDFLDNPQRLNLLYAPHDVPLSQEAILPQYASSPGTINIADNDFHALDPAVDLLSRELAWLNDTSSLTPQLELGVEYDGNFDFLSNLGGDEMETVVGRDGYS